MKVKEFINLCVQKGFVPAEGAKALRKLASGWCEDGQKHAEEIIARGVLYVGDIPLLEYWDTLGKEALVDAVSGQD